MIVAAAMQKEGGVCVCVVEPEGGLMTRASVGEDGDLNGNDDDNDDEDAPSW